MIQRPIHHENIAILNAYAPNNKAVKYVKQKLTELKEEIDKPTNTAGDLLSTINRTVRQKISMNIKIQLKSKTYTELNKNENITSKFMADS